MSALRSAAAQNHQGGVIVTADEEIDLCEIDLREVVAARLRRSGDTVVVCGTGDDASTLANGGADVEASLAAGAVDYLVEPLELGELENLFSSVSNSTARSCAG